MGNEIRALTSLRGIAALAVVLQHFSATSQLHAKYNIPSLAPHGYMAVDFFFVLSGFIMCYTYLNKFERGERGAYAGFLVKRIARIIPLNAAVLGVIVAGGLLTHLVIGRNLFFDEHRPWTDLPVNLIMIQGLGVGHSMNDPSWSVSVELAAYLAFPALIALAFHRRATVRVAFLVVSLALLMALWFSGADIGREVAGVLPGLMRCFSEFGLGMVTFAAFRSGRWARLATDEAVILLLGAVGLTLILRVDPPAVLLFPLVVFACAHNRGMAAIVLGSPAPYFLGLISYSMYLMHNMFRGPLLLALRTLHPQPLETLPALGFALAGSLLVIPFAWVGYIAVERPGRHWVRRLLAPSRPRVITS